MAETIYNTPASTGMIPNFSMALCQTVAAFFILLSFTIIAALGLRVVIEMYLVVGGASILLAFGGSRFTTPLPWFASFDVGPSTIITKVCSVRVNWPLLLNLVANIVILPIITKWSPRLPPVLSAARPDLRSTKLLKWLSSPARSSSPSPA
jgi:hypothetical protein